MNPNPELALQAAILAQAHERKPAETFWASGLGMCPRRQIAQRAGLPPTVSTTMQAQFKMATGTVLGRWISDLLIQQGYLDPAWTEKRLELGGYSGRPDGFTPHINGGAIWECKTCDDRAVTKNDMPEHYLWQSCWYAMAANVNTVVIFQIGKNQGLSKHRVFTLTDEWKEKILTEMQGMDREWIKFQATQILPPCNHRFPWEDKWCSFQEPKEVVCE